MNPRTTSFTHRSQEARACRDTTARRADAHCSVCTDRRATSNHRISKETRVGNDAEGPRCVKCSTWAPRAK
eukprot:707033-Pleurochrysis_carterae.AAC.2